MPTRIPTLAQWITAPGEDPQNPLLRRTFELDSPPVAARLLVTGLGTFRAHVNDRPISDSRLDPGLTDPRRRVQVCEAEVSSLLTGGENVLAIELGRGFHAMRTPNVWRWHEAPWRGPVRAWAHLRLDLADGTTRAVTTSADWRTRPGPVVFDSMYEGETFSPTEDPAAWRRPGYDDGAWSPVLVSRPAGGSRHRAQAPDPALELQRQEPVRELPEITPQVISSSPERIVLDMERVIAGWCRYRLREDGAAALAGPLEFVARHGEKLRADGSVDDENEHVPTGRFQQDRVRLDPSCAPSFAPRHSYKGFRYVQLEPVRGPLGALEVTGVPAHADLSPMSTLSSSEPYLEQFDAAMRASLLNNMHHVPTDTPMHEKNGWTGDALTALAAMTTSFDMRRMLGKWLLDQVDGQREDGSLPVISPSPGWGYEELSPAPEWTCLLPVLLDELVTEYGQRDLVPEHGPAAARYLAHELGRRDADGLISGVLGDYLTPGSPGPSPEDGRLSASLVVARALRALAHAADLAGAGRGIEAVPASESLGEEAAALEHAVCRVFLDPGRGLFRDPGAQATPGTAGYRQTSNLLPLAFGIVPEDLVDAVVGNLVADIAARGDHHDCGHLGVRHLLPVLSAHGHGDLAWRVLTAPTAPGWRQWLEAGNSTFMEMWHAPRSCSHYFMGTPATWIHEHVAGLRRGADGWDEFLVAPDPLVPVDRIAMTRSTALGEIVLEVDRQHRRLTLEVPSDARAQVELPGASRTLTAGRHVVDW